MINELTNKDLIKAQLESNLDFGVEDFPVNTFDYRPAHVNGEILIKSLGEKTINNLINSSDILSQQDLLLKESTWRLELINKDFSSIDAIYTMTTQICEQMQKLNFEHLQAGKFYLVDATEPDFNEEHNYQFRTLIFAIPFIYFSED